MINNAKTQVIALMKDIYEISHIPLQELHKLKREFKSENTIIIELSSDNEFIDFEPTIQKKLDLFSSGFRQVKYLLSDENSKYKKE
jgi:alkyl hydroperoxide reductase subunit AhpC